MKIIFKESVKTFGKYKNKFEKDVLPLLEELGFNFSLGRTLDMNTYESKYFGTYVDHNDKETPVTLKVNTTHQGVEDFKDGIFITLELNGIVTPIGAVSINDSKEIQDLVDYSLPDRQAKELVDVGVSENKGDNIESQDGSTSKSKEEWLKEYRIMKDGDPRIFANWYNNVLPIEILKIV